MSQVESQAVSYELIKTPTAHNVAALWMQNPPVNALSKSVRVGLIEHLNTAIADDSVELIVISSKQSLFSGGADISEFSGGDLEPNLPAVLDVIENSPKPVVAVLNGPAFGGGLEVALSCHYRVTFASNKVGLPEVNLGILPGAGGTQRLPRVVGPAKALDMMLTGARVGAEEALSIGLITRLSASADTHLTEVSELAAAVAARPPLATAYVRRAARTALDVELTKGLDLELDLFALLKNSEDAKEAAEAFKEKRSPQFTGR